MNDWGVRVTDLVRVGLQLFGVLTILWLLLHYIVALFRRQTELSEIDERIKRALREEVTTEKAGRERERRESAETITSLNQEALELSGSIEELSSERERLVTIAGGTLIAADLGMRYGSHRLKQLQEEERALIAGLPDRVAAAWVPAAAALLAAKSERGKMDALLKATSELSEAYRDVVVDVVRVGRSGRSLAAFLASWVPLTMEALYEMRPDPNERMDPVIDRALDRYGAGEAPVRPSGELVRPLLPDGKENGDGGGE